MATAVRLPHISNTLRIISQNVYIIHHFSSRWHQTMADDTQMKKLREDGMNLKRKFDNEKKNRPARKVEIMKEKYGDKLVGDEVTFKFVSTGCYDSVKSVLLHTGHKSYMFNCGDGIGRKCVENGGKWTKLEHIFITHKSWKNIAGTFEMATNMFALTNDNTKLKIIGLGEVDCLVQPENRKFHGDMKGFAELYPIKSKGGFEDAYMTVQPVVLWDETRPGDEDSAACAFKLQIKQQKRKVDPSKLVMHCVKPGPWLSQLIDSGEAQTVGNKTIRPEDILYPATRPERVVVIECPSVNHLPSLLQQKPALSLRPENSEHVDAVIHMSPADITQHADYQQWISEFPPTTTHLILSEKLELVNLNYAWQQQVHLNKIEDHMFPLLHPKSTHLALATQLKNQTVEKDSVIYCPPNSTYKMRSTKQFITSDCHEPSIDAACDYWVDKELVLGTAMSRASHTDLSDKREYPVVSILGTASAIGQKVRNFTGILMQFSEDDYMVLDCGPGTYNQLLCLYGPEKTEDILRKLKFIFISHGHADHHAGVLTLISARKDLYKGQAVPTLYMTFPKKLSGWYKHNHEQLNNCFEGVRCLYNQILLDSQVLTEQFMTERPRDQFLNVPQFTPTEYKELMVRLQLKDIKTVNVDHAYSKACFGISVEHKDWKVVFSGDTMPCDRLITAAQGADLLIHEATMGDNLEADAKLKTHSTVSQAIDVGERSKAKFTLLTHFSNRYPRFPDKSDELMAAKNVGIAFDNVVFRLRDLPNLTLASLWDTLAAMYPQYACTRKQKQLEIRQLKEQGVEPAEITRIMNKRALKEEAAENKRRAVVQKRIADHMQDVPVPEDKTKLEKSEGSGMT